MPATKDIGVHGIGEGGPGVSAGCPEGEPVTMPATKKHWNAARRSRLPVLQLLWPARQEVADLQLQEKDWQQAPVPHADEGGRREAAPEKGYQELGLFCVQHGHAAREDPPEDEARTSNVKVDPRQ